MRVGPLERVLTHAALKQGLGEDLWTYLYSVLADQNADNVRNDVAHGLISWDACNGSLATTLIHLLMILTPFHFQESAPPAESADAPLGDPSQ